MKTTLSTTQAAEIIVELKKCRVVDSGKKILIKAVDYAGNPLSPVDTAYKVHYTSCGVRRKSTYFGLVLGFQG